MEGYPDRTFRGQQPLTRYEMAVILKRLLAAIGGVKAPTPAVAEAPPTAPPTPPGGEQAQANRAVDLLQQLRAEMKARGMSDEEIERVLGPAARALQSRQAAMGDERINELIAELEKEMRGAGLSEDRVEQALRPLRGAVGPPVQEKPVKQAGPEEGAEAPTAREGVNLFGQSGVLVTPSANILPRHVGSLGYARLDDSNILHLAFAPTDRFEVSITDTAGDLPSRLLLGGKLKVFESHDATTRVSVGVLDVTDEIDTSLYGVVSKDVELHWFGKPRRATISAGLGGGLLKGLFGGLHLGLTDRVSLLGEVVDFGGATRINFGAEYRPNADLHLKLFSAQSDFGGAVSYERQF
jgi:hypothetical protein